MKEKQSVLEKLLDQKNSCKNITIIQNNAIWSADFSLFYSFDIDGEIGDDVLGYLDTREFSCPYKKTESCIINGEERHEYYIVPRFTDSEIIIEHVLYDENGNEIGTEVFKRFKNTYKDYCLKITCPVSETKALYRVTVISGDKSASFDLKYTVSTDKPVKLIRWRRKAGASLPLFIAEKDSRLQASLKRVDFCEKIFWRIYCGLIAQKISLLLVQR